MIKEGTIGNKGTVPKQELKENLIDRDWSKILNNLSFHLNPFLHCPRSENKKKKFSKSFTRP